MIKEYLSTKLLYNFTKENNKPYFSYLLRGTCQIIFYCKCDSLHKLLTEFSISYF